MVNRMEYRIYKLEKFEQQILYFLQGRKKHNIFNKIFFFENEWYTIRNDGSIHTSFCNPAFIYSTEDYDKIIEFKKWVEEKNG